jgi:hypothetical protein
MAAHLDSDFEEVRLAMALNGGVSLAVWMGGCAVELDAAAPRDLGPGGHGAQPGRRRPPVRTVYHALCSGFRRELVIDIMTGASAGGINGGLLAAGMVAGRRLHPDYVRRQWLTLGDFADLMHVPSTADPRSLMQGPPLRLRTGGRLRNHHRRRRRRRGRRVGAHGPAASAPDGQRPTARRDRHRCHRGSAASTETCGRRRSRRPSTGAGFAFGRPATSRPAISPRRRAVPPPFPVRSSRIAQTPRVGR